MFSDIRIHLALQCILTIGLAFGESRSDINDVMTLLFTTQKYNKKIRPLDDQRNVINITMFFSLNSIIDFDVENESLKTAGHLVLSWKDEYLQWDATKFNKTNFIFVVFQTTCEVEIRYFPFDVQTCNLHFTSSGGYFILRDHVIKFHTHQEYGGIYMRYYAPNSMWDIHSTAGREVDRQSSIVFELTLKRKPGYYIINIIVPIILLSILNSFSFVLPITSGERASFSVTVFLSLAVFLTIVSSSLPKNSDSVSLLSVYLFLMTVSSTVTVVLCLVEARLATRNTAEHAIGNGFLTLYKLARTLRCQTCRRTRAQSTMPRSLGDVNWIDIVDSMDLLLFLLFMTLTILSAAAIFAIAACQQLPQLHPTEQ